MIDQQIPQQPFAIARSRRVPDPDQELSDNRVARPLVVFIAGAGRSGSTLLGDALAQMPGCFHAGELRFIIGQFDEGNRSCGCGRSIGECAREPGVPRRWCPRICGCGRPLAECELWQTVQSRLFPAGSPLFDMEKLGRFSVDGMRHRPRSLLRLRDGAHSVVEPEPLANHYIALLKRLYSSVAEVTGANVIIDSSKVARHIYLGTRAANVRAHVVHLVRDPRAIAYSWRRRSIDEVILGPTRVAINWLASNLEAEALSKRDSDWGYTLVRYEDVMRSPRSALESIAQEIGVHDATLPFVNTTTLHMKPSHTVAGSPSRFRTGDVRLVPDEEWRAKMPLRDRLLATAPAAVLLRRYAYPVRVN